MENQQQSQFVFSFEGAFWIKISESNTCVGWNSIPSDAHFTIAYNENSSYINLHATRNSATSMNQKFEIFRINKTKLCKIEKSLVLMLFCILFKEISMQDIYEFSEYMVPIDAHQLKYADRYEKILIDGLALYIKKKGANRYKANSGLINDFEALQVSFINSGKIRESELIIPRRLFWTLDNKSGFYYDANGNTQFIIQISDKYFIFIMPKSIFFARSLIRMIMKQELFLEISARIRAVIKQFHGDLNLDELNNKFKKLIVG